MNKNLIWHEIEVFFTKVNEEIDNNNFEIIDDLEKKILDFFKNYYDNDKENKKKIISEFLEKVTNKLRFKLKNFENIQNFNDTEDESVIIQKHKFYNYNKISTS